MGKRDTVSFENAVAVKDSGQALLVIVDGMEVWFPKSQIVTGESDVLDVNRNDRGTLVVTRWIAEQKGLV